MAGSSYRFIGTLLMLGAIAGLGMSYGSVGPFGHFSDLSTGFLLFFYAMPFGAGLLLVFAGNPSRKRRRVKLDAAPQQRDILKPQPPRPEAQRAASVPEPAPALQAAPSERDLLETRKDEIETKINRAKVQYGLGQLSGMAYKTYLSSLERERAELEAQILAMDMDGAGSDGSRTGAYADGK